MNLFLFWRSGESITLKLGLFVVNQNGHLWSVVLDDVARIVNWLNDLQSDQNDVQQIEKEKAAQCAELDETVGRIAQIESIDTEHACERRQELIFV